MTKGALCGIITCVAGMAELADARDLKSRGTRVPYRFETGFRHQNRGEAICLSSILRFASLAKNRLGLCPDHLRRIDTRLKHTRRADEGSETGFLLTSLHIASMQKALDTRREPYFYSVYSLSIFSNMGYSPKACALSTAALLVTVQINLGVL